jgi:CRP-like cAMP-binding protein
LAHDQSTIALPPLGSDCLVRTISRFVTLDASELAALRSVPCLTKRLKPEDILIRQWSRQGSIFLIQAGVALRYKYLISGKRQVFGYLLPGDLCDAHFLVCSVLDHEIAAVSDVTALLIPTHELASRAARFPNIRRALVKSMEAEFASLQNWVLNLGRRNALQRLAHFLCELWRRLETADDIGRGEPVFIPLSLLDIADTMGLTVAHVSRCMQQFRRANLILWSRRALIILDLDGLQRVADQCDGSSHPEMLQLPRPADVFDGTAR